MSATTTTSTPACSEIGSKAQMPAGAAQAAPAGSGRGRSRSRREGRKRLSLAVEVRKPSPLAAADRGPGPKPAGDRARKCGPDPFRQPRGPSPASTSTGMPRGSRNGCRKATASAHVSPCIRKSTFRKDPRRRKRAERQQPQGTGRIPSGRPRLTPGRGGRGVLLLVGVARFELTTPASRRQCSTRLSYTPTEGHATPPRATLQEPRDRTPPVRPGPGALRRCSARRRRRSGSGCAAPACFPNGRPGSPGSRRRFRTR